ncbi:Uu.00g066140.m01.CDS01 [Anthostomella pinea]|uniref:Uu.00g066140.m01.CDS01 n=1 Tax=Anthostomella pinea TaxID=933095 RepID=A0AAI8VTX8_9PEZI|nr:Uu.00g066140.m01.CDS01 [Anthostomella pinea]
MSPHAVIPSREAMFQEDDLLGTFSISQNAFLPGKPPLRVLPNSYYTPWESLMDQLPDLIKRREIRERISQLPILTTDNLHTEHEWRRAYVILAFFTHAYIWGNDTPAEILPPPITVPLLAVSKHLDLPPVATYAALNLWNWTVTTPHASASPGDLSLDSLSACHTFTGTESESWFYMVSVAMEAQAGSLIPTILAALRAIPVHDHATITSALAALAACIRTTSSLLTRMHEKCDPAVFYHDIRPFLAGSKNMAHAGLPRGIFYDVGEGKGAWRQLRGGSNGQSSLIQFFDVVLGVVHASGGHSSPHAPAPAEGPQGKEVTGSFHVELRDFMPGPHRRFLEHVGRMGSLRNFALQEGGGEDQRRCREAYRDAVAALTDMRDGHLKIVTRYIVVPSRSPHTGRERNLASVSSHSPGAAVGEKEDAELTGTGGTALLPFLKQSRQETAEAAKLGSLGA